MEIDKVLELFSIYTKEGIILSYQGPFWQEMIEEITVIMSKRISSLLRKREMQKYVSLYIEMAQNIHRYSANREIDNRKRIKSQGLILAGKNKESTYIISGNCVNDELRLRA